MRLFHAELEIDECVAEMWLNDIPLQRMVPGGVINVAVPAHIFLFSGVNTLELLVHPGPRPSQARTGLPGARPGGNVFARLAAYQPGQFTGDPSAPVYAQLSWNSATAMSGAYPRSIRATGDLGGMFGRWHWQDGDPLELDPNTIGSASQTLDVIRRSLAAGNPDGFLRLAEQRFDN